MLKDERNKLDSFISNVIMALKSFQVEIIEDIAVILNREMFEMDRHFPIMMEIYER